MKKIIALVGLLSGMAFGYDPVYYTQLNPPAPQVGSISVSSITAGSISVSTVTTGNINGTFIGLGRNRIINGDMVFDQEKEGGTYSSSGGQAHYALDNWRYEGTGIASFTYVRTSESLPPNQKFYQAMKMTAISSGTITHSDGVNMEYTQDPVYMRDWAWGTSAAVPITTQFWVLASSAGTYTIAFLNGVNSRSYVSTYSVTTANTWQKEIITIPGDTSGNRSVWPSSGNVFGLKTVWDTGSGSDVITSSLNSWLVGQSVWKAAGSINLSDSLGVLYLTGIQQEIGSQATEFEFMDYSTELNILQHYYWKSFPPGTAVGTGKGGPGAISYINQLANAAPYGVQIVFPVPMFATPVMTTYNPITPNAKWWNVPFGIDSGVATLYNSGATGVLVSNAGLAGETPGQLLEIHATANARLGGP